MTHSVRLPRIIQGGTGVGVSTWRLARAVAETGNLGVVSGSMLDTVLVRRLQDGDPGGHMRRAMAHFPIRGIADDVLRRFLNLRGRADDAPYKLLSMYKQRVSDSRERITILANFVEVWLAKQGHTGIVGINLPTTVQMPNLASIYGAMLAGVDYVIMGAGIPREIPAVLDAFTEHRSARIRFDIEGLAPGEAEYLEFDPITHWRSPSAPLTRPRFLAVVSSASLAMTLARKASGFVDGFVVEGPTDARVRDLGFPFWLAGGVGSPEGLRAALAAGAVGIQSATLFAFAEESGLDANIKARVIEAVRAGEATVSTDLRASPTGYPFKVVSAPGLGNQGERRSRVCDLGYLRTAARNANGSTVYRCPAEPVDTFVASGGTHADTVDRRCLCNGLTANIGQAQLRTTGSEPPLVTSGDDLLRLPDFLDGRDAYSAAEVVAYLTQAPDTARRPVTSSA